MSKFLFRNALILCCILLFFQANAWSRKPLNKLERSDYGYYRNHNSSSSPWFQAKYDLDRPLNFGFAVSLLSMDCRVINSESYLSGEKNFHTNVTQFSPNIGLHAVMDWRLNPQLSVRAQLGPSFGGRKISFYDRDDGTVSEYDMESVLLELPVLLKYKAVRTGNNRPYVLAGFTPYIDFNSSKKSADGFFLERKTMDIRLDLGFGMDFYRPYYKFATEFKFSFGLSNIFVDNAANFENDPVSRRKIQSISGLYSNLFILTFLFE